MSEIICPNCGKENPSDLEICEFCQSPLGKNQNAAGVEDLNSPAWLQRIREKSQVEKTEKPPLGDFGAAEERPFEQTTPQGEIPDWLQEIQKMELPQKKEQPPAEEIDWIAKLHEIKGESDKSFSQSTTFNSDEELAAMAAAARNRDAETEKSQIPEDQSPEPGFESFLSSAENFDQPVQSGDLEQPEKDGFLNEIIEPKSDEAEPLHSTLQEDSSATTTNWETIPPDAMPVSDNTDRTFDEEESSPITDHRDSTKSPFEDHTIQHDQDDESIKEKDGESLIPEDLIQPQYSRAPEYSGRLDISDSQRDSITLLKSMLVGEIQPKTPLPAPSKFSGRLMRAILGALLLIVMGYPFFTGFSLVNSQALFAPGVVAMHNAISSLPDNAPFLVVTDFEPAFSGEMRSASIGIIDNLMMKNMDFTIISTIPAGPALARDLFSKTRPATLAYPAEKIAILGFIPGGTTGLQEFIRNPRRTSPLLDDGSFAWTYSAAQSVNTINDYSGVLVITENAEIGRAWVEQLHNMMDGKSLLMVTSAQSAPIMRPYLDSGQITGLVSGRVEGAMYDRLMAAPPRSVSEISSYQMGMVLAAMLILVGGIYGILKRFVLRQPVGTSEDWHGG